MNLFSLSSFLLFVIASLSVFQTDAAAVGGTSKSVEPPIKATTCPDKSTILPCTCNVHKYSNLADLICMGAAVNQTSIETAFREVRRANEIPEDRGIDLWGLWLRDIKMTELDMSPFYGNKMHRLDIRDNYFTKLVTSGNPEDHGSIRVGSFLLKASPQLTRQGFGDVLLYFANEMSHFAADGVDLFEENITGEFVPGLSALTNLEDVYLFDCNIKGRLEPDTWIPKELRSLLQISLSYNKITELPENVFNFYEGVNNTLEIYLNSNKLNESSIHPNSGITRVGRKTELWLWDNQITTLPTHIFQTFLDTHVESVLQLLGNPLICDERLSWIKARREELQERVRYGMCSNDPGYTIFNSKLIP